MVTQERMGSSEAAVIYFDSITYHIKKSLPINRSLWQPFLSRHATGRSVARQDKTVAWGTNSIRAQPIYCDVMKGASFPHPPPLPPPKGAREALRDKTKNCYTKVHEQD